CVEASCDPAIISGSGLPDKAEFRWKTVVVRLGMCWTAPYRPPYFRGSSGRARLIQGVADGRWAIRRDFVSFASSAEGHSPIGENFGSALLEKNGPEGWGP
ncbi:MAG: hypothetical protein KJS68_13160, partial [Alphaproteobacteria bacterium]|nr:hypothetical protein [Alphaproteobacteria bacterium]